MRVACRTKFDITATGVAGNHSRNRMPFVDAVGNEITDLETWNRSRNQQRNWETLQQILNLRTLLSEITLPQRVVDLDQKYWYFEFDVEVPSTIEYDNDPVGVFKLDCRDVPMITGLDEDAGISACLQHDQNIEFKVIDK